MGIYSYSHICQCLTRLSTLKANSVVTIAGNRQKTGQQFVDDVMCLVRQLLQVGLLIGDVVVISAFNSDSYLQWLLAIAYVGGIAAPLNYRWNFEEARCAMLMVKPVILVTDDSCSHWNLDDIDIPSLNYHVSLDSASSKFVCNKITNQLRPMENSLSSSCSPLPLSYSWAPDAAVIICFTSGTTGRPKGVTISHSALIVQSLAKIAIVGYGEDDVYLHTAPLCHIGGLSSAMAMLMVGACHIFLPKFEAKLALQALDQYRVTSLITVPAIMADLISSVKKELGTNKESLTKILNGGGSLSNELIIDAAKIFPRAKIFSAYGMTETCSSLTFMILYDPTHKTMYKNPQMSCTEKIKSVDNAQGVCVGKPAPHVELKVHLDNDSSFVGKIMTRGPHVMLRYWDQVKENGVEDWFDTGDIGSMDSSGNVWLIGRSNGRIKSGGENVYPEEVESVLVQHPGIIGAVVVGVPDNRLTEMVVACIRLKHNWQWSNVGDEDKELLLSTDILRDYCRRSKLTGFKIPKLFILWSKPFAVTTSGKIKRDQVRVEVTSRLQILPSHL